VRNVRRSTSAVCASGRWILSRSLRDNHSSVDGHTACAMATQGHSGQAIVQPAAERVKACNTSISLRDRVTAGTVVAANRTTTVLGLQHAAPTSPCQRHC